MQEKTYQDYIGIDVAKSKLDICIRSIDSLFQIANQLSRFKILLVKLGKQCAGLAVVAAMGRYEQGIVQAL